MKPVDADEPPLNDEPVENDVPAPPAPLGEPGVSFSATDFEATLAPPKRGGPMTRRQRNEAAKQARRPVTPPPAGTPRPAPPLAPTSERLLVRDGGVERLLKRGIGRKHLARVCAEDDGPTLAAAFFGILGQTMGIAHRLRRDPSILEQCHPAPREAFSQQWYLLPVQPPCRLCHGAKPAAAGEARP